jgi:hypothetical protein
MTASEKRARLKDVSRETSPTNPVENPGGPRKRRAGAPGYNLKDNAALVGLGGGDAAEAAARWVSGRGRA